MLDLILSFFGALSHLRFAACVIVSGGIAFGIYQFVSPADLAMNLGLVIIVIGVALGLWWEHKSN
ncbi:MAG: hypothetical protein ACI8UO_003353 [Verrucomicrobiales bacterium]|jgi:hypothetical protein